MRSNDVVQYLSRHGPAVLRSLEAPSPGALAGAAPPARHPRRVGGIRCGMESTLGALHMAHACHTVVADMTGRVGTRRRVSSRYARRAGPSGRAAACTRMKPARGPTHPLRQLSFFNSRFRCGPCEMRGSINAAAHLTRAAAGRSGTCVMCAALTGRSGTCVMCRALTGRSGPQLGMCR